MEKHLLKKSELKPEYGGVLEEYYLPHHAVVNQIKKTIKVRVVFNASTSSRNSLNDILFTGPTLQPDLMPLILQ